MTTGDISGSDEQAIASLLETAMSAHQAGHFEAAAHNYSQLLEIIPDHADALHLLGVLEGQRGRPSDAAALLSRAVAIRPQDPNFRYNLAKVLRTLGNPRQAEAELRQAIAGKPDFALAHNNLATLLRERGELAEAIAHLQRTTTLRPDFVPAQFELGKALAECGREGEAKTVYKRTLRAHPSHLGAWMCLGDILSQQGQFEEAITTYRQAIENIPDRAELYNGLAIALRRVGRMENALKAYNSAIRLKPDQAEYHANLAELYVTTLRPTRAIRSFESAISLRPDLAGVHFRLAETLVGEGREMEAQASFERARQLEPSAKVEVALATMLPPIYSSLEDLQAWRERFTEGVASLHARGICLDPQLDVRTTAFYLAYQGRNDIELARSLASLYTSPPAKSNTAPIGSLLPDSDLETTSPVTPDSGLQPSRSGKIRVGFVSKYLRDHTLGRLLQGIIAELSREHFEVYVFTLSRQHDPVVRFLRKHADTFVFLPGDIASAAHLIQHHQPDVLVYSGIGMDPATYGLAFHRLAPVQCVTWGHPVTTGIPSMDWFLSNDCFEPPGAETHYSERLARLEGIGTYYYRPKPAQLARDRAFFKLDPQAHIYLCPQTLFKFHPDFDPLLAAILDGDPLGRLALIRAPQARWNERLMARLQGSLGAAVERVDFIDQQDHPDFVSLLGLADVMLDTPHFCGGNTTLEAFAVGTPVVTLPSTFRRGLLTAGFYRQMGIEDCIASDGVNYVAIALRLGTDPIYRQTISQRILAGCARVFEHRASVEAFEHFLAGVVDKGSVFPLMGPDTI